MVEARHEFPSPSPSPFAPHRTWVVRLIKLYVGLAQIKLKGALENEKRNRKHAN